jgi:hypothetical protein
MPSIIVSAVRTRSEVRFTAIVWRFAGLAFEINPFRSTAAATA